MSRRLISRLASLLACVVAFGQTTAKLEFEVVSIKPSPPPDPRGMTMGCHGGPGTDDPVLLTCQNLSLADLLRWAYRLDFGLSAPDWMSNARFDLRAKLPERATKEQIPEMFRSMLIDRFELAVHRETRDFPKYDLVVGKGGPKFKEAASEPREQADAVFPDRPIPGNDGFPYFAPGQQGMMTLGGRWRLYYRAITIQKLVDQIDSQLGRPVTDATGLKGKYDISLYWASDGLVETSTTDVGPRLIEALRAQLGLRLEPKKAPMEFLVVDHAERLPTDN